MRHTCISKGHYYRSADRHLTRSRPLLGGPVRSTFLSSRGGSEQLTSRTDPPPRGPHQWSLKSLLLFVLQCLQLLLPVMINCFLREPSAGSASSSTTCLLLECDAGVERLQNFERNSAICTWHGLTLTLLYELTF